MTMRAIRRGVMVATAAAGLATAAPAAADTLTFIRDNNVWLAHEDGSGQYQVTFDGSAGSPYETPSQADDGTVVAIRAAPGQRRQIYRMSQSGRRLNAPIDTPAPGTGAIDAKVSPNGALVAYWFVTGVNPGCLFCISAANQALFSYPDRFTGASGIGTPNTGALPSWMSNDAILLSNGSANILTYEIGTAEAETWFYDGQLFPREDHQPTLTDGEVSRDGSRLALVRGDNQETILLLTTNGAPPAVPTPRCVMSNPTGKFLGPTWSADGGTLAWQEDDGIWTASIAGLTDCPGQIANAGLRVPGATEPDFGPAALNPGPRPDCANPGNPAPCAPIAAGIKRALGRLAKAFGRPRIGSLLRKRKLTIAFTAPSPGTLKARLTAGATTLASGRRAFTAAAAANLTIKLTPAGRKRLRKARHLKATLAVTFTPTTGKAASVRRRVTLIR